MFVDDSEQGLRFVAAAEPDKLGVAEIVAAVRARVQRLFSGSEHDEGDDELATESPALAACYAGSIMRRTALGPKSGRRIAALGSDPHAPWVELERRGHAHLDGFDLHADVAIDADDRQGLEQVLRYGARPAIAAERLRFTEDGRVALELKRRYHDGTTHLIFEPLAFVERLAALVPKPHKNLIIYGGVLAPHAKLRGKVIAYRSPNQPEPAATTRAPTPSAAPPAKPANSRRPNYAWADLMRRAFGVDVLHCPHCGGRLELLAAVMSPPAIRAILGSLGLPTEPPEPRPARAPPEQLDCA